MRATVILILLHPMQLLTSFVASFFWEDGQTGLFPSNVRPSLQFVPVARYVANARMRLIGTARRTHRCTRTRANRACTSPRIRSCLRCCTWPVQCIRSSSWSRISASAAASADAATDDATAATAAMEQWRIRAAKRTFCPVLFSPSFSFSHT